MRKFIGYKNLINSFKDRCYKETLSHAHLISGDNGIGKSILANKLARLILNGSEDREYVDIINYKSQKASFGVEEVRGIIEEIHKKPYESNRKVVIIYEGHKLTIQAQNALLKTIEEPPIGVYIIILCENLEFILDTIKSRCETYKLTPLSKKELVEYVDINWDEKNEKEKNSAIAFSFGVPERVDRYFTDKKLQDLRNKTVDLLMNLKKNDIDLILKNEEEFIEYKGDSVEVLDIIFSFIRDILIYKEIGRDDIIINSDKSKDISQLAIDMSFKKLNNMVLSIEDIKKNINSNISWNTNLRVMIMSFMEG